LGAFAVEDIPPGPAESQVFQHVYDLDANGILTVTATHIGTGKKQGITLDAKTSGRLTATEIDNLVKKAEEMKILDEYEENRHSARERVRILCSKVRHAIHNSSRDVPDSLIQKVDEFETWVQDNSNKETEEYKSRYNELFKEAEKCFLQDVQVVSSTSSCTPRLNKITARYCLSEGTKIMNSEEKSSFPQAIEWFRKAYTIASESSQIDKMVSACSCIGHIRKVMLESHVDIEERPKLCLSAAVRLTDAVVLGDRKVLSQKEKEQIVQDMDFVTLQFFKSIESISEKENLILAGHFGQILAFTKNVNFKPWCSLIFRCYMKLCDLYLKKINSSIKNEDWKIGLRFLSLVSSRLEEVKLIANDNFENKKIKELQDLAITHGNNANGMKYIYQAELTLKGVKENDSNSLDLSLIALDFLHEAKILTGNVHKITFCKAKMLEGNIFLDLIMNKEKGRDCFGTVMDILIKNNTHKTKDQMLFSEAKVNFESLKEKEDAKPKDRQEILKMIEKELKDITLADKKMGDEDFLNFLFHAYPPKHQENCTKPIMNHANSKKKAFIRLSKYYHPDKVDAAKHGEQYKALCVEIAKRVNARFSRM